MGYSAEERAIIWLSAQGEFDYRARVALLRAAKNPVRLLEQAEKIIPQVIKNASLGVYMNSRAKREEQADGLLSSLVDKGYFAVTLMSDDYPEALKAIPDPPLVLYCAGNRALLRARKFCIVGSRLTPAWAEKQGRLMAGSLAKRFAVVTGLAEGGDSAAISGAIASGNLICVLPNGLDECYPAAHASLKRQIAQKSLLVSEYPPSEPLKKYYFHARNRILAGLSEGVFVLSAGQKSGTLITANCALDYGRDVFALPYSLGVSQGQGCNELIKRGACLVTDAKDILSFYGFEEEPQPKAEGLSAQERAMLDVLRETGEEHAATLAARLGLQVWEALAVLSSLEMKNLAVKAGGNRYGAVK